MRTLFKDTKIGRIPDDWDAVEIGKLSKVVTGSTPSTKEEEYWGKDIPFITPTDIGDSKTVAHVERYLSHKGATVSRPIPPYSVCVTCIASIGKTCITKTASATNQQINSILPNEEFSSEYLYYMIVHNCERLKSFAGFTTVPIVKKSSFEKFLVALPPLPEQRKIAEILSTVDETIEKTDASIQETQQLKKGLMQKLFIEGIGHTRFKETKIGRIPEDWELLPFDDCVDKEGHTGEYRKLQTKDYLDEGRYPIIDQGQEFIAGYTNDKNDVYTGSLPVTIFGDHTLFVKFANMKFAIGADGTVLLYPNKNKLTHKFFYYLISNHKIKSEGYQRHVKYLKQKWFAIPPLPEQHKIAEILSEVDAKIETEQVFKARLEQLKKGLMQVLLTGKARVKV